MYVLCWGWGGNGQLGLNDRDSRIKPHVVKALSDHQSIAKVICGSRFTAAITFSGAVFTWGKNDYGQLGLGDTKAQVEPRQVEGLEGIAIKTLCARGSHVLALSSDGRLYSWGRGDDGQLGHGGRDSTSKPQEIAALRGHQIKAIAAGRCHSVALRSDGRVFTWGSNEDGALGRGCSDDSTVPMMVDALRTVVIKQIDCGSRHNIVLGTNKRVYTWGWGIYGQLGLGDTESQSLPREIEAFRGKTVVRVCCGFRHSFAVLPRVIARSVSTMDIASGAASPTFTMQTVDVWAWGWNEYGQLGERTSTGYVIHPMKINALSNIHLKHIAGGGRHTICSVGRPRDAGPVNGTRSRSGTDPFADHRMSVETLAWGRGNDGELGIGAVGSATAPVSVGALHGREVETVSCGWAHSAALTRETLLVNEQAKSQPSPFAISLGDIDAFFGLLVQFIIQIMLIFQLLPVHCGFSTLDVTQTIIPSAATTVLMSNSFFAYLGFALAKKEGRSDVTALPDGINTVLVFAYALTVMAPEYQRTKDAQQAWEVGIFAAFMTGFLQILSLPFIKIMRQYIPRAALLSSVAGVSLAFLSMGFAFEIWENPMIALGPFMLVLICFGSGVKLPFHLPTGLGALLFGMIIAFILYYYDFPTSFVPFTQPYEFQVNVLSPNFSIASSALTSGEGWKYMSVIVPMVLVNVMATLANLETAVAVGDNFDPNISILGDSVATMIGALLGNPFPTNIYIGQPIYKSMGARVSYVLLTAASVVLIALFNATALIVNTIPISCGVGFLLWIGLVITANSFNRTPTSNTNHGAAVALGMVPALAAWAFQLVQNAMSATWAASGSTQKLPLAVVLSTLTAAGVNPEGMITLSQGYLLTSIFLASMMVNIIEREFLRASAWMAVASALSMVGAVHSFTVDEDTVRGSYGFMPGGWDGWALRYGVVYAGLSLLLMLFHLQEGGVSSIPFRNHLRKVKRFVREQWTKLQRRRRSANEQQPLLVR
ncbi:TPA: hypothetical protein N0F65_004497 [Lagenidium giganteum]|uniref:RCC1-like domain-containing protein n=1 Tax=Lagenidium giganteum TaxID=4803 RepID=A0AAV2ZGM3_9STRA|nr:TPA: hypothetical protein N0F65_004497 [Lagenidium giganteum]